MLGMELWRTRWLWLDWIDNQKPLLLGSLIQARVSTHKVVYHTATMQIQWIQGLTREVVQAGCPLQDKTTFPAGTLAERAIQCHAIGVPLSSTGDVSGGADHVLCWVSAEA